MNWSEVLLEAFGVAVISAAAIIVAALIGNICTGFFGSREIKHRMGDPGNDTLAGQHTQQKDAHARLEKGHEKIEAAIEKNTDLSRNIQIELRMSSDRYHLLTSKQKSLDAHVAAIEELDAEMQRLQQENTQLRLENERLEQANLCLSQELQQFADPTLDMEP